MAWFAAAGTPGLIAGYFLRTTVVLALALLAAAAARRRPAAFRHFVLSFALVGLILLPLLSLVPVGWRSPLVPAWMAASAPRLAGPTTAAGSDGAVTSPLEMSPVANESESIRPAAGGPDPTLFGTASAITAKGSSGIPPSGTPRSRPFEARADSSGGVTRAGTGLLKVLVVILWPAGFVILVLRLAVGLAGAVKLTAEGTPLGDPAWRVILERFLALVSLRRKVRLKSHPEVLVPLTWGWRRPVILLPAGADAWTDEERSSALFHELSHVKRADFLVMLLVRTSLALFWWNPLCWVVYRELLKLQEIACDELVLRAGIRPSTYAASLLAFRRSAGIRWSPSAALLGMLGRSSFQERLAAILKQKLTLMEVKMKTKIMLALALVLAVALIGTARPAVGREVSEAAEAVTAIVDSGLPSPASFDVVAPAAGAEQTQAEKAAVQEKEQEKAKAAEKKIVVTTKEGGKTPIVITITQGDEVKTLTLDKPLTITKGEGGDTLVLSLDGKELQVLRGDPLRLEIKGGEVQVLREGKVLNIGEGMNLKIVKGGDEEGKTIVFYGTTKPEIAVGKVKVVEKADAVEAAPEVFIKMRKDQKEGESWVAATPAKEARAVKIVKEGEPTMAWTISEPGKPFAYVTGIGSKDMLDKVRALQEQVQAIKAKKMELSALEESLKKLEAELQAKEEKLKAVEIALKKVPGEFAVARRFRADTSKDKVDIWVDKKDIEDEAGEATAIVKIKTKDDGGMMEIVIGKEDLGREAYEGALANLKKDLPEGYKLVDSKFNEEADSMSFKIAPPEGQKPAEGLLNKLVKSALEGAKIK